MVALPVAPLSRDGCLALRPPPIPHFAVVVSQQAIVFGPRAAGMLAQPPIAEGLFILAVTSIHLLPRRLLERSAQRPDGLTVHHRAQQGSQGLEMLVVPRPPQQNAGDALHAVPLDDVLLAPARLLLGVGQRQGGISRTFGYPLTIRAWPRRVHPSHSRKFGLKRCSRVLAALLRRSLWHHMKTL
jgi:hypothetical protein